MKIRKLLRDLHRDIGYLAVGLTVIFAVSGIAVNHIHEWNPNYNIEKTQVVLSDVYGTDQEMAQNVVNRLELKKNVEGWHKISPEKMKIFLEDGSIEYNMINGRTVVEKITPRPFLREFNILHLNEPKKAWTWFSDFYAINLVFLAISGMFLLNGRKGLKWRGTWLVTIGVIIPIAFLVYYQ